MNDVATAVNAAAGLRLSFPGVWREIPLKDEQRASSAVRGIVIEALGRADSRAQLRAEVKAQLLKAVSAAVEANADRFVIAIEAIPGLPIPSFLGVYSPTVDISSAPTVAPHHVLDSVIAALGVILVANEPDGEAAVGPQRYSSGESEILATSRVDIVQQAAPPGADIAPPPIENLLMDFWLTVPGERRVVLLSFSSPAVELREPLFNLYRAIVSRATWR